ncbi:MAG TPA: EamA family transporter [Cyanobacteria bacterium UBA11149]|nr:EamA family transporter [Cyanobacteria bacterium UBA11367]HBE58076.1 EamA family transporter [Cyanobacteria bacterium UBA11366]HBK63683.1 EamA family transporter [Cyanobacteria bacterium UBA11166]HBR72666.1 EamA family transporter [Cyanobacteria bacterium UBA11159]HBS71568.1 EamA family transporter [Cyanobacteria bacterium UBA11153]HBW90736.1 EamA family transporter [Cyanobacteria bacterium UBA11149]HCA97469.1 EamA family transporter [Cyanobacteria bacterium UBA9226]
MQLKTNTQLPFGILGLIAPFFLWGTAMVAMKGVIPNTTPLFMAGFRLLPAGILVLVAATIMGRPQPKGWAAWLWISFFALVDGTLFQGFLAEGLVKTSAGLGSVMIDSQPIAVAILSCVLFGEIIGLWGSLGLGIGTLGIGLIGLPNSWTIGFLHGDGLNFDFSIEGLFEHGEWLMLLAALSMAVGTVTIRFVSRYADPVTATGWHMVLGGLPLFALSGMWESQQWVNIDLGGWIALGYSTIFGSAIAYGLFFYFASSGNLTSLSALTFLTPIFALFFGKLFLSEVLTPIQWIGVGLTLISIYLINERQEIAYRLKSLFNRSRSNPDSVSLETVTNQIDCETTNSQSTLDLASS